MLCSDMNDRECRYTWTLRRSNDLVTRKIYQIIFWIMKWTYLVTGHGNECTSQGYGTGRRGRGGRYAKHVAALLPDARN
jgi:hypothetical protein